MAKKPLAVSFDDDGATSEEAFVSGAGTGTVAAPSEAPKKAENKPDEKPKSQFENGRITRNSTDIELLKNDLPSRSRNRKANGTNLTIPLYFEELIAIEEALEKENQADSLNDFIRELLLNKAKRVLGDKKYKELLSNELNKGRVVKIKKNKDK